MKQAPTRRCVLATLSSAAAMSLIGGANGSAQEAPPEVTSIRLVRVPGICIAPQYVAEGLLKIEGFDDVQYVDVPLDFIHRSVGTDKVDLSAIDANTNFGGNQPFNFLGTGAFTGHPSQLHVVHSGAYTYVEGDVNGDSVADFSIQFNGNIAFTASDFVL